MKISHGLSWYLGLPTFVAIVGINFLFPSEEHTLTNKITLILVIVFMVVFAAIWLISQYELAKASGWKLMEQHYLCSNKPNRQDDLGYQLGIGYIGDEFYNALEIFCSEEGVWLTIERFLGFGHGSLFVPWSEIAELKLKKTPTDASYFARSYSRVMRSQYMGIKLKQMNHQNIIIPWNKSFQKYIPHNVLVLEA